MTQSQVFDKKHIVSVLKQKIAKFEKSVESAKERADCSGIVDLLATYKATSEEIRLNVAQSPVAFTAKGSK